MDLLFTALQVSNDTRYSRAAAITFLLCDTFQNFADEIKFVWKSRLSLTKVVYLFARYYPLVYLFCKGFYWYLTIGNTVYSGMVNIIFVLRIHALYSRSMKVLIGFTLLCIVELALEFYGTYYSGLEGSRNASPWPIPGWPGCITAIANVHIGLFSWIPCIIVPTCFFIATMLKLRESVAVANGGHATIGVLRDTAHISPVLLVFVRDGAFYYLLTTLITCVCTFLDSYQNKMYFTPSFPWFVAMYSLAGTHMILNLRRLGNSNNKSAQVFNAQGYSGSGAYESATNMKSMAFGKPSEVHTTESYTMSSRGNHSHERTLV
ncbi:hypothetical protein MD484_g1293, partial [Candolleomyces efflorescens]